MDAVDPSKITTPEQQNAVEQNVYLTAATAQQQLTALRNIQTLLGRIVWLLVLTMFFALASLLSR